MDYLQKIDEYFEMLEEALNNPLPINWKTNNNLYIGEFNINNNTYVIYCEDLGDDVWFFSFDYIDSNGNKINTLTNNGDSIKVMGTVKKAFEDFYLYKNPQCILFGIIDSSVGRRRLYDSFQEDFAKKHNLELLKKEILGKRIYSLYNKNINKELMFRYIKFLINREK
jgi:hypothetical protein